LHSIVQIPLDLAPRVVCGRDDPRPRGGELGPASPQFGCPFHHSHLQLVSRFAKLFFDPGALVDQAGALECCRSVIRGKAKQELINLRGKVDAITGRSNQTTLGIDTDGNDNTAAWLDAAVVVENDLLG
jgi:hypothetical protein